MKNNKLILLSPDGEVTAGGGSVLDEDMTGVDTSMPLLAPGLHTVTIAEIKEAPNSEKTGTVLKITLKTTQDALSTKGETLKAGFPLFDNIPLTPTEKLSKESIKKRLAAFQEGVTGQPASGSLNPLAQWQGKTCTVKVKVAKETDNFPESNKIAQYVNERK